MSRPPDLDNFAFREVLGVGGFSAVFLYEQLRPRRPVALKVLNAEGLTQDAILQFEDEADVMATLSAHPSIVTIYSSGIAPDGRPFLVMEYYPGANLRVRSLHEPLPVSEVLRIGVQVASAVETAHRAGILHRDIKPANILTSQYGRAGLTDFGISVRIDDASQTTGLSLPWAPPEAFLDGHVLDERSDVYSLGATLYTLLAGSSPFERKDPSTTDAQLIDKISREAVPVTGRPDVPPVLERLLALTMSKSPELRPGSALELARAMQELEIELRLQPTPIDVLDEVARAAHEMSPTALRTLGGLPRPMLTGNNSAEQDDDPPAPGEIPPLPLPAPAVLADRGDQTVLRRRDDASAGGQPGPDEASDHPEQSAEGYDKTVLTGSLQLENPRPEAAATASSRNRSPLVWLVAAAVALAVLVPGGLGVSRLLAQTPTPTPTSTSATPTPTPTSPSATPTPTPTSPSATPTPTPIYSVRVYSLLAKSAEVFSDTLDYTLGVCMANTGAANSAEYRKALRTARLAQWTGTRWRSIEGRPTLSSPGGCTKGKDPTRVSFAMTAPAPPDEAVGSGWGKPTGYRIQFDVQGSAQDVSVKYRVATKAEPST